MNNTAGMAATLADFAWPSDLAWLETLVVRVRRRCFAREARTPRTSVRSCLGSPVAGGQSWKLLQHGSGGGGAEQPAAAAPALRASRHPPHASPPDSAHAARERTS